MTMEPILLVEDVTVAFGGLTALAGVSLAVPEGAITGLIGPNGAGKTTLLNVISGLQPPRDGRVVFLGEDITAAPSHQRASSGMARTFQRLELFRRLTVYDNLLVAAESGPGMRLTEKLFRGSPRSRAEVDAIVDLLGLHGIADQPAGSLSTGAGRVVELGRALCSNPRLLLLDEPASGLDPHEREAFLRLLVHVVDARETSVMLVEHDVPLVMQACTTIHVLEFGRLIASGTPDEIRADSAVVGAYLGAVAGFGAPL